MKFKKHIFAFRHCSSVTVKNGFTYHNEGNWHYIYTDEDTIKQECLSVSKEYKNFMDVYNDISEFCCFYAGKRFIDGKLRLEESDGWGETYKIYPDDFKSATNTFEYRHSGMSILSAAKNLSADEFIEYCVDRGLQISPINIQELDNGK